MNKDKRNLGKDFRRLKKSFYYALMGIKEVFEREQNIKIQLILAFIVIFYGITLHVGKVEFALLILAIAQVVSLEVINTAFEMYLDEREKTQSEEISIIKNILAASVLLSAVFAVIVGLIIFLPYIYYF